MTERLATGYRDFARHEARRSTLYAELGAGVAEDAELLGWLDGLPVGKRQPNLVFAAYRLVAGTPSGWAEFETTLKDRRDEIEGVMLERRTQTNEAARCAFMLPLLAALPQPIALLEVGASAGLCLLPDRYGYDYDDGACRLGAGPPVLACRTEGSPPLPQALPEVVWRAGLDLDPIDVFDEDRVHWLELLIWPGMEHRIETLRAAVEVARRDPPRIVEGDLTTSDLDALAAEAPRDATLVIFHTAVLAYVPRDGRAAFRERVDRLGATWLAAEAPDLLDFEPHPNLMALARDGERVAMVDGHGGYLSWG
ncbi:DUF2332 domain-containing protein [Solirubrobacter phytolaccae]|uniref:DUF2332 domain-containing protein n=1 Tax=Solirubrobacter phytolaccae TaxID=1404360 RepID=A0A9X3N3Y3_9ACTN|nr:DUF2332 domain-containing protein [Solirubrobacter phytolaccae]MDA0179425.1 DUF2332 domain-containing protein [Solirubrobacter phytolaccae]